MKGTDELDKQFCLATQREVLLAFSKIIAPIIPFVAESIHKGLTFMSSKESDNLEAPWHVMQITWRNSEKIIFAQ